MRLATDERVLCLQSLPVQYQLSLLPNGLVSYRVQVQGEFYSDYNFKSYPFDRQTS